ncbi:uncharacterized protein ARMOST_21429 [Armillaria ostoyae]|uniref:Uncharacterized protein n=1 Tax=Armillaria ostoyae TaxID=47428 RepID=A0A284SA74_ARMOS|nr:uncharacterized protein ARMOST_21429 [Armillaria ostoyae]
MLEGRRDLASVERTMTDPTEVRFDDILEYRMSHSVHISSIMIFKGGTVLSGRGLLYVFKFSSLSPRYKSPSRTAIREHTEMRTRSLSKYLRLKLQISPDQYDYPCPMLVQSSSRVTTTSGDTDFQADIDCIYAEAGRTDRRPRFAPCVENSLALLFVTDDLWRHLG